MAQHNELGIQGENAAAHFLESKGYCIVTRNWRFHGYEIDIVAQNKDFIVFVEVKTRTSKQWGDPADFVGKTRIKRMVQAAHDYLIEHNINKPARFDIIGVVKNGNSFDLDHIEDAFLPPIN